MARNDGQKYLVYKQDKYIQILIKIILRFIFVLDILLLKFLWKQSPTLAKYPSDKMEQ